MLVGPLTVLENIILGSETTKSAGILDLEESRKSIGKLTKGFNISVDLNSKTDTLPVGTQQKIEILKILYRRAEILILDEPTAVLTPQETDELFSTLRKLKSEGKTIIIITHKLGEVLEISDTVTVLRQGKMVGELETKNTSDKELANLMVGYEIKPAENPGGSIENNPVLEVTSLNVENDKKIRSVKNVSFTVSKGEMFGIAGVEGNGQTELVEAVNGLRKIESGTIRIHGKQKIAHIPADRHRDGIVMDFSVSQNMILGRQNERQFGSALLLKQKSVSNYAEELIKQYDVRPANSSVQISGLSGGNQQKTVVARELSKGADLITVSHPTRGLDIKATEFVHKSLLGEKQKGKAVLLVSSDLNELLKLADRIAVMYNGEITIVLDSKLTNERELGLYMTGVK
jgi:simple sugar transport system ATP-binding protein